MKRREGDIRRRKYKTLLIAGSLLCLSSSNTIIICGKVNLTNYYHTDGRKLRINSEGLLRTATYSNTEVYSAVSTICAAQLVIPKPAQA